MSQKMSADEVATVINARKILKAHGFSKNQDIQTICNVAGISRKTGYQRANRLMGSSGSQEQAHYQELERLRAEHEELKKRFEDVRFENEGRKLAWEIHRVDELLAEKKSIMVKPKGKKR